MASAFICFATSRAAAQESCPRLPWKDCGSMTGSPHRARRWTLTAESTEERHDHGRRRARCWLTSCVTYRRHAGANLDAESRAALREINLHFHDLRREAGSRWMDAGTPLATIQRWLGHDNISQTSTYLGGTTSGDYEAMRVFEARRDACNGLATDAGSPGREPPPTATALDGKASKTTVSHGHTSRAGLGAECRWFESSRPNHFLTYGAGLKLAPLLFATSNDRRRHRRWALG